MTDKKIEDDMDEIESMLEDLEKADSVSTAPVVASVTPTLKNFLHGVDVSADLRIDTDDLDAGLSEQAGLYAWYSVAASKAHYQYERAKANAELISAQQSNVIREEAVVAGKKLTAPAVEAALVLSSPYQAAQLTMNKARQIHNHCRSIAESMEQRQQMLIQSCKRAELEISMTGRVLSRDQRVMNALAKNGKT